MTEAQPDTRKTTKDWQTQPFDVEQFADPAWAGEIQRLPAAFFQLGAPGADLRWQKLIAAMVDASRQRMVALREGMLAEFVGKQEIVEMMIACAIAYEPMVLIGPPGTAKSALIRRFCQGLRMSMGLSDDADGNDRSGAAPIYFQYLLSRFTEPDELFGPLDIAAYRGDDQGTPQIRRIRQGMITQASIVFLDEIFKANSAILNTLLSLINERIYFENGHALPANTRVIMGASNEVPRDQTLKAFYERFPIRLLSRPISQDSTQFDLMQPLLERGWSMEQSSADTKKAPEACFNDLVLLNRQAVEGAEDITKSPVIGDYLEIVRQLNEDQSAMCSIDDRKLIKLYKVVRALAIFDGDQENRRHLRILRHTWDQPQEATTLSEAVDYFIEHPLQARAEVEPHEFQQAGLAYSATDVAPGKAELETLIHWLAVSGQHWYRPLGMRGYAAPWFFLHDVGLIVLWGAKVIRPHPAALSWSSEVQVAYDNYATYLGRMARLPLLDSVHRWLRDLRAELWQRGYSDEARAQAELGVTLAVLEWLLDTIEPAIGWRRLAIDLRWRSGNDTDSALFYPPNVDPVRAARNLQMGLAPDGETPPERPFVNFLRQVVGTGEQLWQPAKIEAVRQRWFDEIAIRSAADYHNPVRAMAQGVKVPETSLMRFVPKNPMRTRALRPLDTALIERYLAQKQLPPAYQIRMELDSTRQERLVDNENPLRMFTEGFNGILRRGPIGALLKRELADDELFYAKFADNSLTYLGQPELLSVPYSLFMGILVDTTLNFDLADGSPARSVAKELALYLLDNAQFIPQVAPGLAIDSYLFQFSDQGVDYQGAQTQDIGGMYAQYGIRTTSQDALPGEYLINMTDMPTSVRDPWLLRADALSASYFNLITLPGRDQPSVTNWNATGIVYPEPDSHVWDIGTQTRQPSRLTGHLTILGGDAASLTVELLSGQVGTAASAASSNRAHQLERYTTNRGLRVSIDVALPPGAVVRLHLKSMGTSPVQYRLNLNFAPGVRSLHIGPTLWPAAARLAQIAMQRLAERDGQNAPNEPSSYSLAHLVLITGEDFNDSSAAQLLNYLRREFEGIAQRVAIHVFRLSREAVSWQLNRGEGSFAKAPQLETLDELRGTSKIRLQFWHELRRDLLRLGE